MFYPPTPPEQDRPPCTQNAPWMPLNELADVWAAFGRQTSTATAARATSEAFAAIADERAALHTCIMTAHAQRWQTITCTQVVTLHQYSIESLVQAATHWFAAAYALQEYSELLIADDQITHEDAQSLVRQTLAQRLRVWTIAQHLLAEQVASSPPTQEIFGATLVTDCPKQQQEVTR